MKNKGILIAVAIITLLVGGFLFNRYQVAPKIKLNTLALTDLNGQPFSLDTFHNKKLFINFFATWCGPCMKELPSLYQAQQILEPDSFQFVLISDESTELLQRFNQKTEGRFLILHAAQNLQQYKIYSIPTSYLINTSGEIIFKQAGEEDWASEAILSKLKKAK